MAQQQLPDLVAGSAREQRSLSRALRAVAVAVAGACAGAVLYSNWLLEVVFTSALPDPDAFISELAATDQPYGAWFRGFDLAAAVILVVAATAGLAGERGGRWARVGWWTLAVFAIATGLDSSVWTLECAPHSDYACAAREALGAVSIGHRLHTLSSVIGLVAAMVSLLAFVMADRDDRTKARVRRVGRWVLGALIATSVWTGLAVAIDSTDLSGEVGIAQRAQLVAVAGWLIYVALRAARAPTSVSRPKSLPYIWRASRGSRRRFWSSGTVLGRRSMP